MISQTGIYPKLILWCNIYNYMDIEY